MSLNNAKILQKIGCSPVLRPDGSHDFVIPCTEDELAAIRQTLPDGTVIQTVQCAEGIGLKFRPSQGMTPDILALAAIRGVITENVSGDGI